MAETRTSQALARAKKPLIEGSTLGAGVLLVGALIALINYFGYKYHARWDWTSSQIYSLSEKSLNVIRALDKDVEAVVFMAPGSQMYGPVRELLARYEAASPRIKVRLVDAAKNRLEAQRLVEEFRLSDLNVVAFAAGDERRVIAGTDLAEYDYSGRQMGQPPRMTGFKGEQKFTGALLELQESKKPTILVTTGHGEVDLDSPESRGLARAHDFLGQDNFDVKEWASLGQTEVPAGTDLVLIPGPTSGFLQPELDVLSAYLAKGGRALVLLDPTMNSSPASPGGSGLETWLANYGVKVENDIVIDPSNLLPFFGAGTIFANAWGDHPISKSLRQANEAAVFSVARSVSTGTVPGGLTAVELVKTSSDGWGERDLANLDAIKKDPTDAQGPVALAVVIAAEEKAPETASLEEDMPAPDPKPDTASEPSMRLVVFGDSDFASNAQLANGENPTLLADTINWLVEREQALGIAAKAPEETRLNLTRSQVSGIFWLVLGLLPLTAISAGVGIHLRRRR